MYALRRSSLRLRRRVQIISQTIRLQIAITPTAVGTAIAMMVLTGRPWLWFWLEDDELEDESDVDVAIAAWKDEEVKAMPAPAVNRLRYDASILASIDDSYANRLV
jgi:hypothetical protein